MTDDVDAIQARLKGYIETVQEKPLDIEPADLTDKHLVDDLSMDSLDIVNLLFRIEKNEGVVISEAELEASSLYRLGRLAEHIQKAKASGE